MCVSCILIFKNVHVPFLNFAMLLGNTQVQVYGFYLNLLLLLLFFFFFNLFLLLFSKLHPGVFRMVHDFAILYFLNNITCESSEVGSVSLVLAFCFLRGLAPGFFFFFFFSRIFYFFVGWHQFWVGEMRDTWFISLGLHAF